MLILRILCFQSWLLDAPRQFQGRGIKAGVKLLSNLSHGVDKSVHFAAHDFDGKEAWALLQKQSFSLVITDVEMPNMDGFEMLKLVRANPKIKDTKVIMLTANSSPEFVRSTLLLGVRDFMVKPFEDSQLIAKVLRQVQLTRA